MRIPINTIDGISRTIYAHYSSAGWSDFIPMEGGNPIPHTAVLEIMEVDKTICLNSKVNGKRFSRLSVTDYAGNTDNGEAIWRCVCDCGCLRSEANRRTIKHRKRNGQ